MTFPGFIRVTFTDGTACWLDVVQYLALDPRTVVRVQFTIDDPTAEPL